MPLPKGTSPSTLRTPLLAKYRKASRRRTIPIHWRWSSHVTTKIQSSCPFRICGRMSAMKSSADNTWPTGAANLPLPEPADIGMTAFTLPSARMHASGSGTESMEIRPGGASLNPRSRFAKFVNLPKLQQLFRAFGDVQTAELLGLPRPELENGKATVVAYPMSDEQHDSQPRNEFARTHPTLE